jgi:hypothetical protein
MRANHRRAIRSKTTAGRLSFALRWAACGSLALVSFGETILGVRTVQRAGGAEASPALTFEREVRPILKTHCFMCHGEEEEKSGELDLRLVRLMQAGGESGAAIVAGKPEESLLWKRIEAEEMPPGPKKLSAKERELIANWIRDGAKTARDEPLDPADARFTEEELGHWAFRPVTRPSLPEFVDAGSLGPIDRLVLASLRKEGLDFAPQADPRTWLRRVRFGLTGLPPTPQEIAEFLADTSPNARQKVVDRLLQSPQYGVRWARHWLDVAGYAESEGQAEKDQPRPHAWRYRDYVVKAFNDDLPYDKFLIEQLAGDLLIEGEPDPNNDRHAELLAATGFLRQVKDITQTDDTLANRNQTVADTVQVFSSAVLGLTVACAQCHDHRYDPITIEDYYRLRAVFDPVMPIRQWKKPSERLIDMTNESTRQARAAIEAEAVALQEEINARRREHCQKIQDREIMAAPEELRETLRKAVTTPEKDQTPEQKALLEKHPKVRTIDWIVGQLVEYDNAAHRGFQEEEKKVAAIRDRKPIDRLVMAVRETNPKPESHVFFRGDPESPQARVEPGELAVLLLGRGVDAGAIAGEAAANRQTAVAVTDPSATTGTTDASDICDPAENEEASIASGVTAIAPITDRLSYARHLTDGKHPLVARVIVNRVWMHHFGEGLVRTPGDFGLNGSRPSHPELLDWLADDFVRSGWSIKRLHRQIVLSQVYGQASGITQTSGLAMASGSGATDAGSASPDPADGETRQRWMKSRELDPDNRWLGRMKLRRLDAEAIRDAVLAISGQLDDQMGGPSVPVSEDDEGKAVIGNRLLRDGLFAGINGAGSEAFRRSLYLSAHRSLRLNVLQTFDLPELSPNCQQRGSSTVTPQALLLMNDGWVVELAERISQRVWDEGGDAKGRVKLAFELTFGHEPTEKEITASQAFWDGQTELFRGDTEAAWQEKMKQDPEAATRRGLASLCQMLVASNRFLYLE